MSQNPYEVLGIGSDADEEEIRQRYLTLVHQFPPDRDPEQFAQVRAAYEQLRDPVTSLEHRLFSLTSFDTLESLVAKEQARCATRRISTEMLLALADD